MSAADIETQTTSNAGEDSGESRAVSVRTAPAQLRTIAETVNGLGTCEGLLDKAAVIAPAIEGQVLKILIKHGDAVKAGEPIIQLDPKLAEANLQEKISTRDGLKAYAAIASIAAAFRGAKKLPAGNR